MIKMRCQVHPKRIFTSGGQELGHLRDIWLPGFRNFVCKVVRILGNHMAHAATRISHIPLIAGDHMQVKMEYRLPCRGADVDAYVVTIRSMFPLNGCACCIDCVGQRGSFFPSRIEPGGNVSAGNQQSMPRRDGEPVPQPNQQWTFEEHATRQRIAERAGFVVQAIGHGFIFLVISNVPGKPAAAHAAQRHWRTGRLALRVI